MNELRYGKVEGYFILALEKQMKYILTNVSNLCNEIIYV